MASLIAPPLSAETVRLIVDIGSSVQYRTEATDTLRVLTVDKDNADSALAALQAEPGIDQVEFDRRVFPAAFDDPRHSEQWALTAASVNRGGANLLDAWLADQARARITVAVVDTGLLPDHIDLPGTLPGYDFISELGAANDGDGRDADPRDPGDWVSSDDVINGVVETDCPLQSSTWHGTGVAGVLGATRNNSLGIVGAATDIDILPVRVMGKCGGLVSDLIAGIRWAAGLEVHNAPDNPNPAQVINLSLGFASACTPLVQQAITDARQAGAIVVAAAGNQSVNMDFVPHAPATCDGVVTVGAVQRDGARAPYSSFGSSVDIMAPGGTTRDGVLTTEDSGNREPANDHSYGWRWGTSVATPHVSATIAMMLAVNPFLSESSVRTTLSDTSTAIGTDCTGCGAGSLNALEAVRAAAGLPGTGALQSDLAKAQGSGGLSFLLIALLVWRRGTWRLWTCKLR